MKKIISTCSLLIAVLITPLFISCTKADDSIQEKSQDPLLGKWLAEQVDVVLYADENIIQEQKNKDITESLLLHFEFKPNNLVSFYQKDLESGDIVEGDGTYKILNSKITITIDNNPETFEYEINKGVLSLKNVQEEEYQGQKIKLEITYYLYK